MRPPRRDDTIAIPLGAIRRLLVVLVLLALVGGLGVLGLSLRDRISGSDDRRVDHSAYQAVFLVTSQVFYGKLQIEGDNYLLTDVYYLSQPSDPGAASQLVKRGSEVFGPREPMIVPARSVLFIENLRDDSAVVVAIRSSKSGQTNPPVGSAPPAATPTAAGSTRPSPTR